MGTGVQNKSLYHTPEGEKKVMEVYEAILNEWQVPHEVLNIHTRQGNTFIIASGSQNRPPLILLHGTDSNALYWLDDIRCYCQYFRVYAPDNLGEPGKSAPLRPDWNGPAYLEWMEDVLEGLNIQETALLGLSQGGWLALKLATSHPERVNRLVLVSPAGIGPLRLSFVLRLLPWLPHGVRNSDRILQIVFGEQPIPPDVKRFSKPMFDHFISRKRIMPIFSDTELQRLTMPTLLIVSQKDAIFNANKIVYRLKRIISRNLKVVVLPHAGHSLYGLTDITMPFLSDKTMIPQFAR